MSTNCIFFKLLYCCFLCIFTLILSLVNRSQTEYRCVGGTWRCLENLRSDPCRRFYVERQPTLPKNRKAAYVRKVVGAAMKGTRRWDSAS